MVEFFKSSNIVDIILILVIFILKSEESYFSCTVNNVTLVLKILICSHAIGGFRTV